MVNSRVIVAGAIAAAAMLLWLGPFAIPGWAVVGFLVAILLMSVGLTAKRVRQERRLVRVIWQALTGK
jgi:hypothetical protein